MVHLLMVMARMVPSFKVIFQGLIWSSEVLLGREYLIIYKRRLGLQLNGPFCDFGSIDFTGVRVFRRM